MRKAVIIFALSLPITGSASAQQAQSSKSPTEINEPVRVKTGWFFGKTYLIYSRPDTRQKIADDPLADLTPAELAILEKLNRVTASRLKRHKTLIVPEEWADDELVYSPFPKDYGWAADKPKAIVVDQAAQAFAAYEHGRLVRWGPVSTGSAGQTPAGLFHLSWRSRGHHSSVDPAWYLEWYFNFIPRQGIAFHKYSLPGRAASHGCVRMLERDAFWLFEWGEAGQRSAQGTPVLVLGCPDRSLPWQSADYLKTGIVLPNAPATPTTSCIGVNGATASSPRRTIR